MRHDSIESTHAPSGIRMMPALRWGTHVGHFFDGADELADVLVPYFKAGLDNNEACLWVTDAPFDAAGARAALGAVVPDLAARERSGQIEILDGDAFYAAIANRQADALLEGLLAREEAILAAGYTGLRTNGNCSWCGSRQWTEFQRYEALLQEHARSRRMIVMCSYLPDGLELVQTAEVVNRHDLLLRHPSADGAGDVASDPSGAASGPAPPDFQADVDAVQAIASVPVLLKIICTITGMGFSAVARVTEERWVCLAVHDEIGFGLRPGGELGVETTLCHEVWGSRRGIVINHVAADAQYRGHHTPAMYGFQSYISMPIFLRDGSLYGTLCAIDPEPADLRTSDMIGMFRAFAELIGSHIDADAQLDRARAQLLDVQAATELHDQIVAVLGCDLRNPISAIAGATRLLARGTLDERARSLVDGIEESAARMTSLVENIVDLTRSRLDF